MSSFHRYMKSIEPRSVLPRYACLIRVLEQLCHHTKLPLLRGCHQRRLPEIVGLVDHRRYHLRLELLRPFRGLRHLGTDVAEDPPHRRQIPSSRREMELDVVVPARHLLHVLFSLLVHRARQNQSWCRAGRRRLRRRRRSHFQVPLGCNMEKETT